MIFTHYQFSHVVCIFTSIFFPVLKVMAYSVKYFYLNTKYNIILKEYISQCVTITDMMYQFKENTTKL